EPGHRIGLMAPNSLAYLPAAFGLLATGACLTPLATHLTPAEAAQITTEVQVNGRLSWPKADRLSGGEGGAVMSGGECDGLTFQWTDRDAAGPVEFTQLNPAFVRFTSGTTASSARIAPAVIERFEAVYGVPLGQAYGISEAGLPCINLGSDGLPATSVGHPVPGYDIAVFGDEGKRLHAGALGEIAVRGDGLF